MPEFPYIKPDRQIQNRNPLLPTQFLFTLTNAPKVAFFSNTANIPSIDLGIVKRPTPLKTIDEPGDTIEFEDFRLKFIVDENLENYLEIFNWIIGLGYPYCTTQFENLKKSEKGLYSDGTLQVLTSSERQNFQVKFYDLFPYGLTTLLFDSTLNNTTGFTAEVKFKYTYFQILDNKGNSR